MASTYKVQDNGKAPTGLQAGDSVVTAGGTYKITGVNSDGSYKSEKVSNTTTSNYTGSYASAPSSSGGSSAEAAAKAAASQANAVTSANSKAKKSTASTSPASTSYSATAAQNASVTGAGTSAAGVTPGYTPTGTYNDAELRAAGQADYIDQKKAEYDQAKAARDAALAKGDTNLAAQYESQMVKAHNEAELYRNSKGYYSSADGSEYHPTSQGDPASNWSVDYGGTQTKSNYIDGVYVDPEDQNRLSATDLQTLINIKKAAAADPTNAAKYNKQAEQLRMEYGYSMGASGNQLTLLPKQEDILTKEGLQSYQPGYELIEQLSKAGLDSNLSQLQSAYNNSRQEMEYQMGKLPAMYQNQRNAVSADNERQKMAFREQAAASGMNAGNRSQASLAFANQLQNNLGQLNTAEANALADVTHDLTMLYTEYQGKIAQAYADNNFEKMAKLIDEYSKWAQSKVDTQLAQASIDLQIADFNRQTNLNKLTQQNADRQYNLDLANMLLGYGDWTAANGVNGNSTKIAQYLASQNPEMYYILKSNGYL